MYSYCNIVLIHTKYNLKTQKHNFFTRLELKVFNQIIPTNNIIGVY